MYSKNQPEMKNQEAHEIKYHLDSLKDESTAIRYKFRLNLKVSNITFVNIIKCLGEAAMETSGKQQKDYYPKSFLRHGTPRV